MTDREKAIIMAFTGVVMLTGKKFSIFHKYIEDLLGRPVQTIELAFKKQEIKEKSKADFFNLCASEDPGGWIPVSERLPQNSGYYLTTTMFGEVYCDYWTETRFDRQESIIAWMPLPKSYKGES